MVPIETWNSMVEEENEELSSFLLLDKKQQGHLVPLEGRAYSNPV